MSGGAPLRSLLPGSPIFLSGDAPSRDGGKRRNGSMDYSVSPAQPIKVDDTLEMAKARCIATRERITQTLPPSRISDSCKRTLLRLVNAELRFLSSISTHSQPSGPVSTNIGYLEAIVRVLQHPSITGVSRVCKPVSSSQPLVSVHVDIVCTFGRKPVWIIVSDRNPSYIPWLNSHRHKGLRARVEQVLTAASSMLSLKPDAIILFFSSGLSETVSQKLVEEFRASEFLNEFSTPEPLVFKELEEEWVNLVVGANDVLRAYEESRAFEINIASDYGFIDLKAAPVKQGNFENQDRLDLSSTFCSLISALRLSSMDMLQEDLINFDTTALIALVSGISNGATDHLLKAAEDDMRKRFKSNYAFVMAQVTSEVQNPILRELRDLSDGKKGIICESVCSEFKELVKMCGGPNEKSRADQLVECLMVVSDSPSPRIMGIPTTRKIAMKNKIVFGTGDHWHAPTLTANMGFVRAISQTGMSLSSIEHRPRALTGD